MGPLRKGRFCARSGQGAPTRIRVEAPSIKTKTTSGANNDQKKGEGPPGGGRVPPEQRSSGEGEGQKQGFLLQSILSGQEGRRAQAVINLGGLNVHIEKKTFRMASLKDVSQSLRSGDWAAIIDLEDAYLHVPIAAQHRRFHRFWWKGSGFQFSIRQFSVQHPALSQGSLALGDSVPGLRSEDNCLLGRLPSTRPVQV